MWSGQGTRPPRHRPARRRRRGPGAARGPPGRAGTGAGRGRPDVALARLAAEFQVPATIDHLPYELARRTDRAGEQALQGRYGVDVLTRIRDGTRLALFANQWRLRTVTTEHPDLILEPLLADTTT